MKWKNKTRWGGLAATALLVGTTLTGMPTASAAPGDPTVPLIDAQVANPSASEAFAGCENPRVLVAADRSGSVAGADPANVGFMRQALNGFAAQMATVPNMEVAGISFGTLASGQSDVSADDHGPVPGPAHELHGQWAGVRAKYPWLSGWKIDPTWQPGPFPGSSPAGSEGMSGYVHATDKGLYPPSPQIPDSENPSVGWVSPTGQGLNDWFAYVGAIRYDIYNGTDPDVGADPNLSGFTNYTAAFGDDAAEFFDD